MRIAFVVPTVLIILAVAVGARPAAHASVQEWQPDCALLRTVYLMARLKGEGKATRYAIFRAASTFTNASRTAFDTSIPLAVRSAADRIEGMGQDSQRESIDELTQSTNVLVSTGDAYREACPEEAAYVINSLALR